MCVSRTSTLVGRWGYVSARVSAATILSLVRERLVLSWAAVAGAGAEGPVVVTWTDHSR